MEMVVFLHSIFHGMISGLLASNVKKSQNLNYKLSHLNYLNQNFAVC